jgi:hypothetical protein
MKYFFEIENRKTYFGFIFKQGSNASTTSTHPTPLIIIIDYILVTYFRNCCAKMTPHNAETVSTLVSRYAFLASGVVYDCAVPSCAVLCTGAFQIKI